MDNNDHGGDALWIGLLVVLMIVVFLFAQDLFDVLGIGRRPPYLQR